MKKLIKVVMLPTEDSSDIFKYRKRPDNKFIIAYHPNAQHKYYEKDKDANQHVYITVSQDVESIKEGDWIIVTNASNGENFLKQEGSILPKALSSPRRKIIATTDVELGWTNLGRCDDGVGMGNSVIHGNGSIFKPHLPQLQQSFLKEFVANPDKKFQAEYWDSQTSNYIPPNMSNIKLNKDNEVNITSVEEKMYSREEVEIVIKKAFSDFRQKNKSVQYVVGNGNPNVNGKKRKYTVSNVHDWIKKNL